MSTVERFVMLFHGSIKYTDTYTAWNVSFKVRALWNTCSFLLFKARHDKPRTFHLCFNFFFLSLSAVGWRAAEPVFVASANEHCRARHTPLCCRGQRSEPPGPESGAKPLAPASHGDDVARAGPWRGIRAPPGSAAVPVGTLKLNDKSKSPNSHDEVRTHLQNLVKDDQTFFSKSRNWEFLRFRICCNISLIGRAVSVCMQSLTRDSTCWH